jgi:hypothetical protein
MKALSGGSGKAPPITAFWSPNAQPRIDSRVPEVSFQPNAATVADSSCPPISTVALPSIPPVRSSSPTQVLIAEGVMLSETTQAPPSCSWLIGG